MTGTYSKLFTQQSPPQKIDPDPAPISQPIEVPAPNRTELRSEKRSETQVDIQPENRSTSLPIKRKTKRYSFEFYDDQIFKLKQLKRDAEDNGEYLTLSDMAREALDFYLKSKNPS
jgi:hypothetical protein